MPASLAILGTLALIAALIVWDTRLRTASIALWLPALWLFVTGSRFVSQWLALGTPSQASDPGDGSPVDAAFFGIFLVIGAIVLARRRLRVADLIRANPWLTAFIVLGLLSVAWSDYPFVSLKRWTKTLGHPVMALIILTDPRPAEAFRVVMKRCSYALLLLSVLFYKYLPQFGRSFDVWSGMAVNNGVGLTKTDLGYVCMVSGLFFLWNALTGGGQTDRRLRWQEIGLSSAFLGIALWLLSVSNSKTSLMALIVGSATLLLLHFGAFEKRRVGLYMIAAVAIFAVIQIFFDPYAKIVTLLGRQPDLTDRTEVWADAIALQPHLLVGAGFEAFWLGERLALMWEKWWWRPNQAHSGYIETYLNMGLLGVSILLTMLVATFRSVSRSLQARTGLADLRLAILLAIIVFNYTEATFKATHFLFTMFYIIALRAEAGSATALRWRDRKKNGRPARKFNGLGKRSRHRVPARPEA
jgi:O-antigen ligase